jgi:hypothetical protein
VVFAFTTRQLCLNPGGLERVERFTMREQQIAESANQTKSYGHWPTPQSSGIADHRQVTQNLASDRPDREDRHQNCEQMADRSGVDEPEDQRTVSNKVCTAAGG